VICGHQCRGPRIFNQLAALQGNAELRAEEGLSGGCPEADDQPRLDDGDFGFEPCPAGDDLGSGRMLVHAPLAALLELRMLDGVGHVYLAAIQIDRSIEQATGGADEWPSLLILWIAGDLADENDPSGSRAFAKHRLLGILVEIATLAVRRRLPECLEIKLRRQEIRSRPLRAY